jgi:hypothetical protein
LDQTFLAVLEQQDPDFGEEIRSWNRKMHKAVRHAAKVTRKTIADMEQELLLWLWTATCQWRTPQVRHGKDIWYVRKNHGSHVVAYRWRTPAEERTFQMAEVEVVRKGTLGATIGQSLIQWVADCWDRYYTGKNGFIRDKTTPTIEREVYHPRTHTRVMRQLPNNRRLYVETFARPVGEDGDLTEMDLAPSLSMNPEDLLLAREALEALSPESPAYKKLLGLLPPPEPPPAPPAPPPAAPEPPVGQPVHPDPEATPCAATEVPTMKFSILPEQLLPHLQRCAKIALPEGGKKKAASVKQVHEYVAILAQPNLLLLRVQEAFVQFEARVLCETVEHPGEALVPCDKLVRILKTRASGYPVDFSLEAEFLVVQQGEFRAKLPLLRDELIEPVDLSGPFTYDMPLEPKMQAAILRNGSVLGDGPDTKYGGVLLDLSEPGVFWVVGLGETYYFGRFDHDHGETSLRAVFPTRALPLLSALSAGDDVRLAFDQDQSRLVLHGTEFALSARCPEDTYPSSYVREIGLHRMAEGVYPVTVADPNERGKIREEKTRYALTFDKAAFLDALVASSCLLHKEEVGVELHVVNVDPSDNRYVVEMTGMNRLNKAVAREKIKAASNLGYAFRTVLHHPHARDIVKGLTTDNFTLWVLSESDMLVVTEENSVEFAALLRPLRLDA